MVDMKRLLVSDERLPQELRDAIASEQTELAARPLIEHYDLSCDEVREILQLPALSCG